jgi:hypothetical protein
MKTLTRFTRSPLSRVLCSALLMVLAIATAAPMSSKSGGTVPFRASFVTQFQVNSPPPILLITVQGQGNALHMGRSETFTTNQVVDQNGVASATYYVIAANGDTVAFQSEFTSAPTSNGVTFEGTYTILGGTGRFSGATGSGALDGSAVFTGQTFGVGEFTFEGAISSSGSH